MIIYAYVHVYKYVRTEALVALLDICSYVVLHVVILEPGNVLNI